MRPWANPASGASATTAVRFVLTAFLAAGAASLTALTAGCDRDTEERHLDEMTNEIDHLQLERDEETRKALGTDVADPHFSSVPPRLPAPADPPAPVVNVGDDSSGDVESPDTEDPSPRPTIRVVGSSRHGDVQSSIDDGQAGAPTRSGSLDPSAKRDYEAALGLVNAKQFDAALEALAAFLVKYPDHPYADNALYWRGESYFAKGDYLRASEQFEGVVTRYPAGNKAPDALLKLGVCRQKLGDPLKAKEYFDRLAQSYPQSEAARHIPPVRVSATTPSGPASEDHR